MVKWKRQGTRHSAYRLSDYAGTSWFKLRFSGKDNFQSSPLLRLPGEIREMIYRETVGNHTLHIDLRDRSNSEWKVVGCEGDFLREEKDGKDATMTMDNGAPSSGDISTLEVLYQCCDSEPDGLKTILKRDTGLRLLQTCRQIYDEASPIFWSTTTFGFRSSVSFELWLDQMSGCRVRLIRSLRFDVIKSGTQCHTVDGWSKVLGIGRVRRLVGLRHLRLIIYQSALSDAHQMMKIWGVNYDWNSTDPFLRNAISWQYSSYSRQHLDYLQSLKKMSVLPLTKVEVSVRDAFPTSRLYQLWSMEDRQEYARAVRDALLDPQGSTIYTHDIQRALDLGFERRFEEAKSCEYLNIFERLQCGALIRYESQF